MRLISVQHGALVLSVAQYCRFFLGSLTLRFSNQCLPLLGTILYLVTILLLQTIPETKRNSGGIVPSNGTMAVLRAHRKFAILC